MSADQYEDDATDISFCSEQQGRWRVKKAELMVANSIEKTLGSY